MYSFSLSGTFKGLCKQIDHFPEDADYKADASEYFLRELSVRAKANRKPAVSA